MEMHLYLSQYPPQAVLDHPTYKLAPDPTEAKAQYVPTRESRAGPSFLRVPVGIREAEEVGEVEDECKEHDGKEAGVNANTRLSGALTRR